MTEPTGATGPVPPYKPSKPSSSPKPLSPSDSNDSFLLHSPFAKMFRAAGATPTVKEICAMINGVLKAQFSEIKRADVQWKKSMEKLKRMIEGE